MTKEHWNAVYEDRQADRLTWYQRIPDVSLALIALSGVARDEPIIDVGCGASTLLPTLRQRGFSNLAGLDLSDAALAVSQAQMGDHARDVRWFASDVTAWRPDRVYRLWHDRAVFHFVTEPHQRAAYRQTMTAALAPGACAIIGTFAQDGPSQCSGLPVRRYSPATLAQEFAPDFRLIGSRPSTHVTPAGRKQPFRFVLLQRL